MAMSTVNKAQFYEKWRGIVVSWGLVYRGKLITQRSQVRILSPLPRKRAVDIPEPPSNYVELGMRLLQEQGKLEKFIEVNTPNI